MHTVDLLADGRPLPVVVNGDEIGFQMSCGGYTALATSYDYFDSCQHWIHLLSSDGKPVDLPAMPDSFGFIQDVSVLSPNEVAFGCFGTNDRWKLVVREQGFWSHSPGAMRGRSNQALESLSSTRLHGRRLNAEHALVGACQVR